VAVAGGVALGAGALTFGLLSPLLAPDWLDWAAAAIGGLMPGGWHGWGAQNSRPRGAPTYGNEWGGWPTGSHDPTGPNAWTYTVTGTAVNWNTDCSTAPVFIRRTDVLPAGQVMWARRGMGAVNGSAGRFNGCGRQLDQAQIHIMSGPATGQGTFIVRFEGPTQWEVGSAAVAISVTPATPGVQGVPWLPVPSQPLPDFLPLTLPELEPLQEPAPSVPAFPAIVPVPVEVPVGDPVTQPAVPPAPAGLPIPGALAPALRPLPLRRPPLSEPALAPVPQPVPQTRPDQIIVGSPTRPIPIVGSPPPPNLPGIAQELGRIERKLEIVLGDQGQGMPEWMNCMAELCELVGPLAEFLTREDPEGVYLIDSPCEVDENGERLPPEEVPYPASVGEVAAVRKRVDALAELLVVHKWLKQPNCKVKPPTGQLVSVLFEETGS
jgi:hypothetical protein